MVNLPTPQSRIEELMNAFITRDLSRVVTPQSRIEEFWHYLIEGANSLPIPQSRVEVLLKKIIENDMKETPIAQSRTEEFLIAILTGGIGNLPIPCSRSEEYLHYIATNNTVVDEDIEYINYSGTNITAHNTVERPIRSAILKGVTKYRDKDTGEILEAFEEGRNLELVSVTMPVLTTCGKNLCDRVRGYRSNTGGTQDSWASFDMSCKPNTTYTAKIFSGSNNRFGFFSGVGDITDSNATYTTTTGNFTTYTGGEITYTITTGVNDNVMWLYLDNNFIESLDDVVVQVEEGSTATAYEPFKSNILTTPSDLTLQGIGDVRDTLDCLTGEVSNNIGVAKLSLIPDADFGNFAPNGVNGILANTANINIPKAKFNKYFLPYKSGLKAISNFAPVKHTTYNQDYECFALHGDSLQSVQISLSHSRFNGDLTKEKMIQLIKELDITIMYELATPIIKTVDLKVVDQDGNLVNQLSAFDSTTHIISGSESDNSLIAIAEVEVPTKVIDGLSDAQRLSTEVDESCIVVQTLQDNQDINSTLAMTAITELYELALEGGEL